MEKRRNDMRKMLFESQDEVDNKKDRLLEDIGTRLKQTTNIEDLFTIRWRVV